jgi:predicted oxidoreductase
VQALPVLKAAWDHGITTWDTANVYSNGDSERIIAKAIKQVCLRHPALHYSANLAQFNIPRHRIQIFTKCYMLVTDDFSISAGQPGIRVSPNPFPPQCTSSC